MTQPWRHLAACKDRDTNYWFPRENRIQTTLTPAAELALQTCANCPVTQQCLDHAMNKPEIHGIWGGLTAEQRRGMRLRQHRSINHGTKAGYEQHLRWGDPPCRECKRAHADYTAARRRINQRAQTRNDIEGLADD